MNSRLSEILKSDPIVITGMGAVSAAGLDVNSLWQAVARKESSAQWVELPQPDGGTMRVGGFPCPEIQWTSHPWAGMARRLDPAGKWALHAAWQAADQANIFERPVAPERMGVVLGSTRGPKAKWEEAHDLMLRGRRVRPTLAATTTLASSVGALAQVLAARGSSWLTSAACASGAFAIIAAAEQIVLGNADVMIAGGADQALHSLVCAGLKAAGVLAKCDGNPRDWVRPFCENRTGLVPGDGAGMLVLESLSSARRRGVEPLATLAGWGSALSPEGLAGMDAHGRGLQRTMRAAIGMAGTSPSEIDYINAHGTGTVTNDAAEAAALKAVFGEFLPACTSSKSITGHCLGATPVMEAILCVEALRANVRPPIFPDEGWESALGLISPTANERRPLKHSLTNSAAFWGFSASLLLTTPTLEFDRNP
jgi:3-oxoacyl-[acyl-carrier-protein] synthase II